MILEQLRDAVRTRLGTPENENFYQVQSLDDLLNESLQTISAEGDWSWLQTSTTFSTVYGTRFYTPPTDWGTTKAVSIQGYDTMSYIDLQSARNYPDDQYGIPAYYTIFDDQLYLAPAPNGIMTIRHDYLRTEPKLTDNSDSPIMPNMYHYSIVAMATHLAHLRSGDLPRANAAKLEYNDWLKRMEGMKIRTTSTLKIRVRPGRDL